MIDRYRAALPRGRFRLNGGASESACARFREAIALPLPESFYGFYAVHDGSGRFECYDVGYYDLMSLEAILRDKRSFDSLAESGTFAAWAPGQW